MRQAAPGTDGITWWVKKPVQVALLQWTGKNWPAVQRFAGKYLTLLADGDVLLLWNEQESCWIRCPLGHYVAKGPLGEVYPISPQALAATYEPAGEVMPVESS